MSEATRDVASDVAADMLGSAAALGMEVSDSAQEALSEAPEAVQAPSEPAPAATTGEQVAEELVAEGEETFVALPVFKPVPEDEFAMFEEEEAGQTIEELKELLDEEDGYTEIEDADELRARLHKLEKALDFQKGLRAKSERRNWEREAKERYPLATVESIAATSRNAFLKAAAKSHNDVYAHLSPYLEQMEAEKKRMKEEAREESKREAIHAWGETTVTGPSVPEVDEGSYQSGLKEVRKTKDLTRVLRYIRESGR